MNQREKDMLAGERYLPAGVTEHTYQAFADGAEYGRRELAARMTMTDPDGRTAYENGVCAGRRDLAKLERLLRAGWRVYTHREGMLKGGMFLTRSLSETFSGATLAEALAQVPE